MGRPNAPEIERAVPFAGAVLIVGLIVSTILLIHIGPSVGANLGDTDDATRLVIVRDLLHGRGWFDQRIVRLQPPEGVWLHWSRLLDGGLALLDRAYALIVGPARAEWLMRATWPLIWVFVGLAGVFAAARTLAAPNPAEKHGREPAGESRLRGAAVIAAGVICVIDLVLYYAQFHPGRIDHHDVQIALCVVAAAGAMQSGPSRVGARICGVATGLGLAVGLEALVFEAVLAAAFGLRLLADRREAPRVATYGVALAVTTLVAFFVQTPPARWGVSACDGLALNLTLGLVIGGVALAAVARSVAARAWPARLLALGLAGGVTLAVYLAFDPNCLHGPFADTDPRIRPFWLDHVQEMKAFPALWKTSRPDAIDIAVFAAMGSAAWILLGLDHARRRTPAWMIQGVMLALGIAFAVSAVRARAYAEWFSVAPLAVLAAVIGRRLSSVGPLFGTGVVAAALAPVNVVGAILIVTHAAFWQAKARAHPEPADHCFEAASYATLARMPPGVVVSEVDLGPFVLAHTPSSAMSAPYHRMTRGLLGARGVVAAAATAPGPGGAEARARAIGADYVLECRAHARHADRSGLKPDSLQIRLDKGAPPPWLTPLSPASAALQLYRLRAAAAA